MLRSAIYSATSWSFSCLSDASVLVTSRSRFRWRRSATISRPARARASVSVSCKRLGLLDQRRQTAGAGARAGGGRVVRRAVARRRRRRRRDGRAVHGGLSFGVASDRAIGRGFVDGDSMRMTSSAGPIADSFDSGCQAKTRSPVAADDRRVGVGDLDLGESEPDRPGQERAVRVEPDRGAGVARTGQDQLGRPAPGPSPGPDGDPAVEVHGGRALSSSAPGSRSSAWIRKAASSGSSRSRVAAACRRRGWHASTSGKRASAWISANRVQAPPRSDDVSRRPGRARPAGRGAAPGWRRRASV